MKAWIALFAVAAFGVATSGSWWHGYTIGKQVMQANHAKALEDLRKRAALLADELEEERKRERIVYRDRIRTVYGEPDPSGCADVRVPDRVLSAIRGATGQPSDGSVREAAPARGNQP